jgi:hypothetical protein
LRALDHLKLSLLLEIERLDLAPIGALILLELDPTAGLPTLLGPRERPHTALWWLSKGRYERSNQQDQSAKQDQQEA